MAKFYVNCDLNAMRMRKFMNENLDYVSEMLYKKITEHQGEANERSRTLEIKNKADKRCESSFM